MNLLFSERSRIAKGSHGWELIRSLNVCRCVGLADWDTDGSFADMAASSSTGQADNALSLNLLSSSACACLSSSSRIGLTNSHAPNYGEWSDSHNQAMVKINEAEAATAGSWDVHEFGLLSLFVALVSGTASFSS